MRRDVRQPPIRDRPRCRSTRSWPGFCCATIASIPRGITIEGENDVSGENAKGGSPPKFKYVRTWDPEDAPRGALPLVQDVVGFPHLCDVLLRRGVYMGLWRGNEGAVLFLDIMDGVRRERHECCTAAGLSYCVAALTQEYDDQPTNRQPSTVPARRPVRRVDNKRPGSGEELR